MRTHRNNSGVTLIEILVVVALIAMLTTMVIAVATRIDNQSKENLTKCTLELVDSALGQFRDYGYNYRPHAALPPMPIEEIDFYRSLKFPIDCNGLDAMALAAELYGVLGLNQGSVTIIPPAGHDLNYSGSEALYFFLNIVPTCRTTLTEIDPALTTNKGVDGEPMQLEIPLSATTVKTYPLYRIVDSWGQPLRYDYYDEAEPDFDRRKETVRSFPVITSSGPDRIPGTSDDIKSR